MQAQWLIFAALLMAVGGALLLLLQARNGSREQRLIERRLGALANPGGSTRWLAGMTERMDDSFWVRRLQLMDSEARQLLQQAGWHESRYRTLYLISVFLTPLLFVLLVLLVKLLRAESEASYAVPLLFAAGIGFLLPKQVLKHFAKARRALIADEMILFVQLIRILFDAGLTVEQTLRVVCLEGRGITPQLARELDLALTRADNGIDLAEELEALARRLQVDPLNDCCGVLRQMLRQGGSARSTLLNMIREGRLHAALANLESMPPGLLDVREERALILRRIGDPRARAEYQALLETCKAPEAHHGLGLLALRNGDSARAVLELREAARLRPTESRFRNDLGVALLKRGDRVGARFEFITALELQQGGKLPATNLLGLLYLQGDREDAQRLIERLQLDARDIRAAEARARSWGAVPTPDAAPASDDPLAELPAEANMHTAMANEAP